MLTLCIALATALGVSVQAQLPSNYNITSGRYGVHIPGSRPDNIFEPLEMRTAFAGPNAVTVSWNTFAQLSNPTVQYGTDARKLDMVASSNISITYPSSRTFNNHVELTGLKAFTKYYYKVQYLNCLNCAYRQLGEFTTVRAAGDTSSFKVAIVADMGTMGPSGLSEFAPQLPLGANETNAIQSMLQNIESYEFIAHWGDFAYADYFIQELASGTFGAAAANVAPDAVQLGNGYEGILEEFYDDLQPLTYNTVYMTAPGNHEASCDGGKGTIAGQTYNTSFCPEGQKNFTGYSNHWRMPDSAVEGSQGNFWYSFDYGFAHFVVIDTETDFLNAPDMSATLASGPFGKTGQQLAWLQADLQSVDRSITPWVVVGGHRPWYVSGSNGGSNACVQCMAAFDSIMVNNSVDFLMFGHVHAYERSWPTSGNGTNIQRTYDNPTLPVHFVNGAGGHWQGIDYLTNPANYSAKTISGLYGWSTIEFHNRTHMTYEFVASANDTVMDRVTLYKAHAY